MRGERGVAGIVDGAAKLLGESLSFGEGQGSYLKCSDDERPRIAFDRRTVNGSPEWTSR
jgi:hypothetical protein